MVIGTFGKTVSRPTPHSRMTINYRFACRRLLHVRFRPPKSGENTKTPKKLPRVPERQARTILNSFRKRPTSSAARARTPKSPRWRRWLPYVRRRKWRPAIRPCISTGKRNSMITTVIFTGWGATAVMTRSVIATIVVDPPRNVHEEDGVRRQYADIPKDVVVARHSRPLGLGGKRSVSWRPPPAEGQGKRDNCSGSRNLGKLRTGFWKRQDLAPVYY